MQTFVQPLRSTSKVKVDLVNPTNAQLDFDTSLTQLDFMTSIRMSISLDIYFKL